jgi:hypothetical protein
MNRNRTPPRGKPSPAAVLLGLVFSTFPLQGQTAAAPAAPNYFDTSGFPQWGKDLRRAEIIAFGTFPFTMFTATLVMDTLRASKHNWDGRYMPWPLKTAGAIEMTNEEHELVFISAAAASATLALADFVIVKIKQYRSQRRALEIPEGTPIIIRRPLPGAEGEGVENSAEAYADDGAEAPAVEAPAPAAPGAPPAVP